MELDYKTICYSMIWHYMVSYYIMVQSKPFAPSMNFFFTCIFFLLLNKLIRPVVEICQRNVFHIQYKIFCPLFARFGTVSVVKSAVAGSLHNWWNLPNQGWNFLNVYYFGNILQDTEDQLGYSKNHNHIEKNGA